MGQKGSALATEQARLAQQQQQHSYDNPDASKQQQYTIASVEKPEPLKASDLAAAAYSKIVTISAAPVTSNTDPEMVILAGTPIMGTIRQIFQKGKCRDYLDPGPSHALCSVCQEFLRSCGELAFKRQPDINSRVKLVEVQSSRALQAFAPLASSFRAFHAAAPKTDPTFVAIQAAKTRAAMLADRIRELDQLASILAAKYQERARVLTEQQQQLKLQQQAAKAAAREKKLQAKKEESAKAHLATTQTEAPKLPDPSKASTQEHDIIKPAEQPSSQPPLPEQQKSAVFEQAHQDTDKPSHEVEKHEEHQPVESHPVSATEPTNSLTEESFKAKDATSAVTSQSTETNEPNNVQKDAQQAPESTQQP